MWKYWNPNPCGKTVGDCPVRALTAALGLTWYQAYDLLCAAGRAMCDMPSSDALWGRVLMDNGFRRYAIPNSCPDCYTARMFCEDHPSGIYVLAFGGHVATVIDGEIWDSWDSTNEVPIYVFKQ